MLATSAGMYHASVAFLPSSFSMYFVMLGSAFSFKSPSLLESKRIVYALQLFGIGAIFGWPYAAIISFPAIIEELFIRGSDQIPGRAKVDVLMQVLRKWRVRRINSVLRGVISGASLLLVVGAVDSYYYDRITLSLWNAVKYNLFGGSKRGPDLYGTEPWTYYFANGFINFNIVFVFALLSLPLWGCQYVLWRILDKISTRKSRKKHRVIDEYLPVRREPTHPHMLLLIRMIPFYLVLAIFTLQPHKEERFLYIIYPYICFNGAVSLHLVRSLFNEVAVILGSGGFIRSTVATSGKLNWLFLTISTVLSTMRIFALFHYYSRAASLFMALPGFADTPNVPMDFSVSLKALLPSTISGIDHSLHNPSELEKSKITNVCIGKEWHRFPSHYFMPHNYHLRFLQTPAFKGQLPGDFLPVTNSLRESTSHIQKTFNDMNREEPSHYWKESKCDYVVDIDWTAIPDSVYHEKSEPLPYARQTGKWEKVRCAPYLDKDRSKALGRVFYTPEKAKVFIVKLKNWFLGRKDPEKEAEELDTWIQWGEACLLKPKK
ncbi:mannosyltransferase [Mycoemilia scoparia]|uniref:Mannosyltransferase n=1 Tax=Mycoemilia scoparia TaxID=417184 RepID=A0A9W7ZQ44_9FUNG|nr:mannosyltransferase [Mycoemilia scoparia]